MRDTARRVAIIGVVVAVVFYGWRVVFPDDESAIAAVLERIAEGVSESDEGGDVGRLARAASLRDELAPDVTVDAGRPFQRITGREAIVGAAARIKGSVRNLELSFADVSIEVAPNRNTATATVTAEARFDDGGSQSMDARELEIGFKRLDGNWVVAAVSLTPAIERIDQQ